MHAAASWLAGLATAINIITPDTDPSTKPGPKLATGTPCIYTVRTGSIEHTLKRIPPRKLRMAILEPYSSRMGRRSPLTYLCGLAAPWCSRAEEPQGTPFDAIWGLLRFCVAYPSASAPGSSSNGLISFQAVMASQVKSGFKKKTLKPNPAIIHAPHRGVGPWWWEHVQGFDPSSAAASSPEGLQGTA